MAKQDFEQFKQEIKNWLDNHLDEYDAFVEDINSKSYQSIQQIYSLAMRLAPKLMKRQGESFMVTSHHKKKTSKHLSLTKVLHPCWLMSFIMWNPRLLFPVS